MFGVDTPTGRDRVGCRINSRHLILVLFSFKLSFRLVGQSISGRRLFGAKGAVVTSVG